MAESEHPDKERLDWLDKEGLPDRGWVCNYDEGGWPHLRLVYSLDLTIRDAIDAAMERERRDMMSEPTNVDRFVEDVREHFVLVPTGRMNRLLILVRRAQGMLQMIRDAPDSWTLASCRRTAQYGLENLEDLAREKGGG
jgi:hypothetical protein